MAVSLSSPEDIINASLVAIGYKKQIGSIWNGSEAAQLALSIFGQARDDLMRLGDWDFVQRTISLTLLKTAQAGGYPLGWTDAFPPPPWTYEYEYPDNCLKIRAVKPLSIFSPNFDPQPYQPSIYNDNSYTPAKRTILSYVPNAMCVYAGRITDPLTWPADFAQALVDDLGKKLAQALASAQAVQMMTGEARVETAEAKMEQG